MASVQFRGIDGVLKAYDYKGIDLWAVFEGKRLCHKGSGSDELKEYLELTYQYGSNGTYILKVYEDLSDAKQIKSSTPDDGSFNFKLVELDADADVAYRTGRVSVIGQIGSTLQKINERLELLEKPVDEEPEEETFSEALGNAVQKAVIGAIENPAKIGAFMDAVKEILGFSVAKPAIGNITRAGGLQQKIITGMDTTNEIGNEYEQEKTSQDQEERLKRLASAIDTLERFDSEIVEHLEKLSKIAANNPKKFASLITMLDMF